MTGNIAGDQNPRVGTVCSYEIKPSGLSFVLNGDYEWYLYKKQKNGSWKDITGKPKTGEKVTYNFGEIALGVEFQIKVYEIKKGLLPGFPVTKELAGSLTIVPISNKVPKIDKVVLFNRGAKDFNTASYRDTLIAQAHCIAMFNKEIEFHLWEDDASGKGHDASINQNNRHTRSYKARVNEKGIAEVSIHLISDEKILRQMANQFLMQGDRNEGTNHEYYVTATYSRKIQGASQVNVEVANPDYKGQPQNQPKPKPQPEKHTPKFPAGQGGGPKQPDPKGNIIEAVFIDDTGKELSKVGVGDKVRVRIHTKNMVGKHIQYVIWKYDSTSTHDVYRSAMIKIPADICDTSGFVITKDIFEKGTGSATGGPDYYTQNYFIEIISKDLSAESQKFGVNSEGLMEMEKVKSVVGVQKQPEPNNSKDKKCPRCKKLTEDELKRVFPAADSKLITEIVKSFNEYCVKFNINTCTLKAHFFAQAKQESSDSLLPAINGESMNYSVNGLLNTGLKNVSSKYKFGTKTGLEMAKDLGRKEGESTLSLDRQIKIANFIYGLNPKAKDLGNKAPADNKNLEEANNEGWRYRGRGMLQITGKHNYTEIENHVNSVLGKNILDIKAGRKYDSKFTPTEALLSGLGDWSFHKMYIPAKIGVTKEVCLEVIKLINSATKSKTKRIAYLIGGNWYPDDDTTKKAHTIKKEDSMKVIFRVDDCLLNKETEPLNTTAAKIVIKFGENADKSAVSEKSLNILREVGEKTKNYLITITSTARDPYNQARVMYDNIVKKGMKEQRNIYKASGQKVLDIYDNAKAKGKNKQEIIKEMEAKIKELGPKTVSKHCEDPKVTNVLDITQAMSHPKDFKNEIASRVDKVLDENGCYHIEIKQ
ncbi:hypothetical protein [Chryseobacterium sp. AG844]|uniref:hypothetical protein n=1 Tax=Chryseobacterium sp. AG844 TaxID=2183998 RepID=UPI000D71C3E0|nr:hypothetical protein [Chryseobacterium sp. AG844]PWW30739.1 hypothetical protein DEU40_101155 [Chryseobacterium sp. AG844]